MRDKDTHPGSPPCEGGAEGGPGFTLVELLIVLVVLAVVAAIVLPKFVDSGTRGTESTLRGDLKLLREAIDRFHNDTGSFPAQLRDLAGVTRPPSVATPGGVVPVILSGWNGPYIDDLPVDPISGLPFAYRSSGPDVGQVRSSAVGRRALDGTLYTSW